MIEVALVATGFVGFFIGLLCGAIIVNREAEKTDSDREKSRFFYRNGNAYHLIEIEPFGDQQS